jgi:hypothetical protein
MFILELCWNSAPVRRVKFKPHASSRLAVRLVLHEAAALAAWPQRVLSTVRNPKCCVASSGSCGWREEGR